MMWGVDGGEKVAQEYAGEQREWRDVWVFWVGE